MGDLESVDVHIAFGAGELVINSLAEGSPQLIEARFRGREAITTLERDNSDGELNISMEDVGFPFFGNPSDVVWELSFSTEASLTIDLDGGAASMTLDLSDLRAKELNLDIGATDLEIIMPAHAGHVVADIDAGAASIDIVIPVGVAANIGPTSVVGLFDIDEERFPRAGDSYVSPGYDTAANRIDLEIDAGASSITIR